MAGLSDIVFDCAQPARLARFWAAVLDGYEIAPYDEGERARLRAIGVDDIEDDPSVLVQPATGQGIRFWFQRVAEPKLVKNRVHVDLRCDDPDVEIVRLVDLGAHTVDGQPSEDVVVLQDPEGNEFCIIRR